MFAMHNQHKLKGPILNLFIFTVLIKFKEKYEKKIGRENREKYFKLLDYFYKT